MRDGWRVWPRLALPVVLIALALTLLPADHGGTNTSAAAPGVAKAAPAVRPNIVVVMADDMRSDDLRFSPVSAAVGQAGADVQELLLVVIRCAARRVRRS